MKNFSRVVVYMGNVNPVSRNFAARGYYPGVVSSNFSDGKSDNRLMKVLHEIGNKIKSIGSQPVTISSPNQDVCKFFDQELKRSGTRKRHRVTDGNGHVVYDYLKDYPVDPRDQKTLRRVEQSAVKSAEYYNPSEFENALLDGSDAAIMSMPENLAISGILAAGGPHPYAGDAVAGASALSVVPGVIGAAPAFKRWIKDWGPFRHFKYKRDARKAAIDYVNKARKENAETRELADRLDSFSRPRFPYYR